MVEAVRCSRCGDKRGLHLVIIPYSSEDDSGRLLLYCRVCRDSFSKIFSLTMPLVSVTTEFFLELYRNKKTSSDPLTAVEIVFGVADLDIVRSAKQILAEHNINE
jgi:hypothetical protein